MLLISIVLVTLSVPKGLGKHVSNVPPENMSRIGFMGNFTGTFSILAAVWSKTSFALTLLRLMSGRMRILLWVIIATINIFMGLNAIFMWARCSPPSKVWEPFGPGTCWGENVYPSYGMFAAGGCPSPLLSPGANSKQATQASWTLCWRSCRGR